MIASEFTTTWEQAADVALSATLMYLAIVAVVRINGLRSFSKMSSFDFATTVATGSLLASIALTGSSLANGVVALVVIFVVQAAIAVGRRSAGVDRVVDNRPVLLMADGRMLEENLGEARMTRDDVRAKLRLAGVIDQRSVRFVVLETTGDISIATTDGPIDADLLRGVKDAEVLVEVG